MKAYLAGPDVFYRGAKPLEIADRLKAICAVHGITGLFPLDNQIAADDGRPIDQAIFEANCDLIRQADVILAHMMAFRGPGMDGGTAWEMGAFWGLGKPIVGYGAGDLTYLEKCERRWSKVVPHVEGPYASRDDMLVEDFGTTDNLMMVRCCSHIATDFAAAVEWVARNLMVEEKSATVA